MWGTSVIHQDEEKPEDQANNDIFSTQVVHTDTAEAKTDGKNDDAFGTAVIHNEEQESTKEDVS